MTLSTGWPLPAFWASLLRVSQASALYFRHRNEVAHGIAASGGCTRVTMAIVRSDRDYSPDWPLLAARSKAPGRFMVFMTLDMPDEGTR